MKVVYDWRPRLSPAARLRFDTTTASYVLLAPERGLLLNASASEIVQRCTGALTVREIALEMLRLCASDPLVTHARVTHDVLELVLALHQRRLLQFEFA